MSLYSELASQLNPPAHYGQGTEYEAINIIETYDLGFCLGNVIKYVIRAGKKNGESELSDISKAMYYLSRHHSKLTT